MKSKNDATKKVILGILRFSNSWPTIEKFACNRTQVPYNRKMCTKSKYPCNRTICLTLEKLACNRKNFVKSKNYHIIENISDCLFCFFCCCTDKTNKIEKVRSDIPTLLTIEKIARNRTGGLQSKIWPIIEQDASYNRNPSPIIENCSQKKSYTRFSSFFKSLAYNRKFCMESKKWPYNPLREEFQPMTENFPLRPSSMTAWPAEAGALGGNSVLERCDF